MTAHITSRQAISVWLFLVIATLGSAWLAEHHAVAGAWTAAFVVAVAYVKVRLILLGYMDLRTAPQAWRLPFEAWAIVAGMVIVGFWWLAATRG